MLPKLMAYSKQKSWSILSLDVRETQSGAPLSQGWGTSGSQAVKGLWSHVVWPGTWEVKHECFLATVTALVLMLYTNSSWQRKGSQGLKFNERRGWMFSGEVIVRSAETASLMQPHLYSSCVHFLFARLGNSVQGPDSQWTSWDVHGWEEDDCCFAIQNSRKHHCMNNDTVELCWQALEAGRWSRSPIWRHAQKQNKPRLYCN